MEKLKATIRQGVAGMVCMSAILTSMHCNPSRAAAPNFGPGRAIIGERHATLARTTDPALQRQVKELRSQVQANGSVRVMIGVRAAFSPEGLLRERDIDLQRDEIASAQSEVLAELSSLPDWSVERRYTSIPFLALEVSPRALERLLASTAVSSISIDRELAPSLTVSVPRVGAPAVWSTGYPGTAQTVAILDTGVDRTHPFLKNKVVSEACYSSGGSLCPGGVSTLIGPGAATPCANYCSHGTHVAGIAAGEGYDAGIHMSGVAQEATIIAMQVFHAGGCPEDKPICAYDSDIIAGLERVSSLRSMYSIAAVNLSLGDGGYTEYCDSDPSASSFTAIIDSLRSYGIATVASSGNEGYTNGMGKPACISNAISVGSTSKYYDSVSSYSNSATFLDLLAPGEPIDSSVPGGGFFTKSGTSMAAPHVAGAFALLRAKNAVLGVSDLESALKGTGVPVTDPRNGVIKPRIQVDAAMNATTANPPATCPPSTTRGSIHCFLTSVGGTTTYKVDVSALAEGNHQADSWIALRMYDAGNPCNSNFDVHVGIDNKTRVDGTCNVVVHSRNPEDHYYGVIVNAEAPNHSASSAWITINATAISFIPDDRVFANGFE